VLRLKSRDGETVPVYPLFFLDHLEVLPIGGWQVIQESADRIRVLLLNPGSEFDLTHVATEISHALERLGCAAPVVQVEATHTLVTMPTGKTPMICPLAE
jgi:hypothetical protein